MNLSIQLDLVLGVNIPYEILVGIFKLLMPLAM
jgi:hypothetical protein